jgi:hypothetical protein
MELSSWDVASSTTSRFAAFFDGGALAIAFSASRFDAYVSYYSDPCLLRSCTGEGGERGQSDAYMKARPANSTPIG